MCASTPIPAIRVSFNLIHHLTQKEGQAILQEVETDRQLAVKSDCHFFMQVLISAKKLKLGAIRFYSIRCLAHRWIVGKNTEVNELPP